MDLDINDIGQTGVVQDEPTYQLPPELWNIALNMRSVDSGMRSMTGWNQVFGTPGGAPHFVMPIVSASQAFWLYTSLTKAYVWDGASHTEITRAAGGNYAAPNTRSWNGTIIGGLPILNNGEDAPQYWSDLDPIQDLLPIPNWPATGKIAVIRAFQNYLVGFNYTVGGANYPHLVKWSAGVDDPGTIPQSWDETDATLDAGEYDLPDVNSGVILEARLLGSKLFIYKERATWTMRYIGGRAVFAFDTYLENNGILAPRCVATTGDGKKHVVATQDDIIIHNGIADPVSIVHKRMRRAIFSAMDTDNFLTSFMYTDAENNEVVFCYPESGATSPNRALVFNYRTGALTEMDGVTYVNVASGSIESPSEELWSDGDDTWDDDTGPWGFQQRNKLIACVASATKLHQLNADGVYTRDGVTYSSTLQRTGLAIIGKKRTGEMLVNHEILKFIERIWPKVQGGPVQVRVGSQMTVNGPVTWGDYQDFDPEVQVTVDVTQSARAIAIEFFMAITGDWRLDGYRLTFHVDGQY
jgi:hypothetical protein